MANFPTTPKPNYPIRVVNEHRTIVYGADNGAEQRQKSWGDKTRRHYFLNYDQQTASTIWSSIGAFYGRGEGFTLNPHDLQSDLDDENILMRLNDDNVEKLYNHAGLYSLSVELIEIF